MGMFRFRVGDGDRQNLRSVRCASQYALRESPEWTSTALLAYEDVPCTSDGLQRLRLFWVDFDLSPEAHDPEVDAAVEGIGTAVVGQVQQLIPAEHVVRMLGERLQQVEF